MLVNRPRPEAIEVIHRSEPDSLELLGVNEKVRRGESLSLPEQRWVLEIIAGHAAIIDTLRQQLAEAEAEIARLKVQRDEWQETVRLLQQPHWCLAGDKLEALTTALSALVEGWKQYAESMRLRKGQMTREKRGHEVLTYCADDLAALLDAQKETQTYRGLADNLPGPSGQ